MICREVWWRERLIFRITVEQAKSMIRATLRSMDIIIKNEAEVVSYLQKDFGLEPKIAADTYKILRQVVNSDGDIEEPVFKSIIDKIRQESGVAGRNSC